MEDNEETKIEAEDDTLTGRFLTFLLGNETYGIEIRFIKEIIGIQTITEMPEALDYIKGIINLRGKIIPVMDVRLRFGKKQKDYDDRTCIIVIDFVGTPIGLIVDSVSEVLTILEENISERPNISSGESCGFINNIGKVNNAVILLLDCGKLLNAQEIEEVYGCL